MPSHAPAQPTSPNRQTLQAAGQQGNALTLAGSNDLAGFSTPPPMLSILTPATVLHLQRVVGNRAVAHLLNRNSPPQRSSSSAEQSAPHESPVHLRSAAPVVQREWKPAQYGEEKWHEPVDGLEWF
jgi:hypothetical protein